VSGQPAPGPDRPPVAPEGLDYSLTSGLAWTGSARWITQVISWASTLIVFRLLSPSDYGIIGMAGVYLGFVQLVSEFGLGTAILQARELNASQLARINGLSLILGFVLLALSVVAAPPIAWFFREPQVRLVVMVLAALYVVTALQVVPRALLARELRFRTLAIIDSAEALVQIAITLTLAVAGTHYWAIVFGNLGAKLVSTGLVLAARPHRLAWPRRIGQLRELLTFGWQVVISRLAWYGYSNADFVVIGRMLGEVALGAYTFGWNIASIPADKINVVLSRVTVPIFASVQHDRAAVARYLVGLSEGLTFLVLPASVGLAVVAPEFVRVVLGDRWIRATVPLELLSLHVTFRCVSSVFSSALLGMGDARQPMRLSVWLLVVMPLLFVAGAAWGGIGGVALMWIVGHPLVTVPFLVLYTARRLDLPLGRLLDAVWPPVAGTAVMAAAVLTSKTLVPAGGTAALTLGIEVSVGALTYPLLVWLLFPKRIQRLGSGLRRLRQQGRGT
jgi:O-antigen/teichoic acid export membrane protein